MTKRIDLGSRGDSSGHAMWKSIGRRLKSRRVQMGLGAEQVAGRIGVTTAVYRDYESASARIPALLLSRLADLYEVPVVWFCQEIALHPADDADLDDAPEGTGEPCEFKVATMDQRVEALAESFRRLDLESQQRVLAIAGALSRPARGRART